jgi:hypothetical protein
MRKLIIMAATAVSALAVAAPASAQYYPQPRGNAYGYNNYGQIRSYHARVDNLRRAVDRMGRGQGRGGYNYKLRQEVGELQYQVNTWGRNGLSQREARELEWRIARVERMVQGAWGGNRRYDSGRRYDGYDGYNGSDGYDRDRDGRDDRYENDRGYDRD